MHARAGRVFDEGQGTPAVGPVVSRTGLQAMQTPRIADRPDCLVRVCFALFWLAVVATQRAFPI